MTFIMKAIHAMCSDADAWWEITDKPASKTQAKAVSTRYGPIPGAIASPMLPYNNKLNPPLRNNSWTKNNNSWTPGSTLCI